MLLRNLTKTFSPVLRTRYLFKKHSLALNLNNHQCIRTFTTTQTKLKEHEVKVTFILHDGKRLESGGKIGDTLLDVVVNNDLNIEGYGACEGTLTCSTCHVVLKQEVYDQLPDQVGDEERDMLDLAYGLTGTSRLGCQITLSKELDGLEVHIPETINDARS